MPLILLNLLQSFDQCKASMLERGKHFLNKLTESRDKVAKTAAPFIVDGSVSNILMNIFISFYLQSCINFHNLFLLFLENLDPF